ncbi:MAG TPA: HD domain-containing protein [Candidatus Limnocylindrales bacterium]|nr:HD domain-containing protein [Candidatus Limnocylindrales bacterium]
MTDKIPPHIHEIVEKFSSAGYEIFLVGGSVRDLLNNRKVTDWDLTTSATPEQMLVLFPDSLYENNFGTVGIKAPDLPETEHKGLVEVTTFRTEKGYKDSRHPDKVEWGKTVEEDLGRRDFTINAMALRLASLTQGKLPDYNIIDPYNGQEDLKKNIIRAVGDPDLRFKEDALRLMRAIRFASQLGFSIEEETLEAITQDAGLLKNIAFERVRDELMKILASEFPYEGIMLLKNTGLLSLILPELEEGIGISQMRPGRHHVDDVFTHNVLSLKFTTSTDPIVRFATLIHDIGKPKVKNSDNDGLVIFHNHEIAGAKIARNVTERLRFSKKEQEKIIKLVRWHMFTVDEHITDSAVRRFIRRIGVENVKDMMDLRVGDRLGGGTQTAESWRLKLFKKRLDEQMAPAPFSINDLAIDGKDIMKELKIKPGPKIGEILQKLFEEVDEDLEKNNKEFLLQRIHEI